MDKPILVLLHGALGSKQQFDSLLPLLEHTFSVHRLDFSGHGGLPLVAPFSNAQFAQELIGYMDLHGIKKAHIFGYSMGGYVALYLARHFPQRVDRLITLATKLDWTPETAAREQKMLQPEVIESKVPPFARALADRHAPQDWKAIMRETAAMLGRLGQGEALSLEDFQQISHPVLLCRAEQDVMVSQIETDQTARFLPQAQTHTLPTGKHPFETIPLEILVPLIHNFLLA